MTNYLLETYRKTGIEKVYSHQKEVWEALEKGKNIILATGTGSGKTEAVLLPSLAKNLRIILIYPTKALLQDQVPRTEKLWKEIKGKNETGHVSIDTGDETDETLFRADVILTTIDKFLFRLFGYGSTRWGYIYPWRIAQSPQKKTLLIFDEAHTYDKVSLIHFLFLIDKLTYEKSVQTAILSATLPRALVDHLRDDRGESFPRASGEGEFFQLISEKAGEVKRGQVRYGGHLGNPNEVIQRATDAYQRGQQVIIIVNRVYPPKVEEPTSSEEAQGFSVKELWEALQDKLDERALENLILYHGHQSPGQRREFLKKLQERDASREDAPKPYILVTTSAFEVGVNVSCDLMFTEVCSPDAFVQRIGRCARRWKKRDDGTEEPEQGEVYTFGDVSPKVSPGEKEAQHRLMRLLQHYKGKALDADVKVQINALNVFDATLLARRRNTIIYTVNASLYDYVYNFVATGAEMWRKGVLVTRDWVPTLEIQPDGADAQERLRLSATYTVPRELVKGWWFEARDVDGRPIPIHGKDLLDQLRACGVTTQQKAVNAYQATLVIWLKPEAWDNVFGLKERKRSKRSDPAKGNIPCPPGMRAVFFEPLPDAPALFWFEPEEEV
ncbi:MAG: CRISPR-associated helicase Cas3' [Caldiserica bacterium]|jgi:CRISPR-associated endonuclease/helicase Cas3|nr:CRISPR-associated helicase Cas3' [Caldisericota bacterium]